MGFSLVPQERIRMRRSTFFYCICPKGALQMMHVTFSCTFESTRPRSTGLPRDVRRSQTSQPSGSRAVQWERRIGCSKAHLLKIGASSSGAAPNWSFAVNRLPETPSVPPEPRGEPNVGVHPLHLHSKSGCRMSASPPAFQPHRPSWPAWTNTRRDHLRTWPAL